jgi:hypothetical protein
MNTTKIFTPITFDEYIKRVDAKTAAGELISDSARYNTASHYNSLRKVSGKEEPSINELIESLESMISAGAISKASLRTYKSTIKTSIAIEANHAIKSTGTCNQELRIAFDRVTSIKTKTEPQEKHGYAVKHFDENIYNMIMKQEDSPTTNAVKCFIKANLIVGMRPSEWITARFASSVDLDGGKYKNTGKMLVVDSAKTDEQRGHGTTREILLNTKRIDKDALESMIDLITFLRKTTDKKNITPWNKQKAITPIARRFQAIINKLKRLGLIKENQETPSLYSTRHQAIANAKAAGLDQTEIAALFGHRSKYTARKHYGKKSSGRHGSGSGGSPIYPTERSINQVLGFSRTETANEQMELINWLTETEKSDNTDINND